ncbi:MAG: carbohydrate kinase, partial [bacterium]|nr:carbohydrate kinase [Candidatus Colisoma equi]
TVECVTPMYERIPEDEAFVANNYNVVPYFGKYVAYAYSYTGGALVDWATKLLGKGHLELQQGEYRPTGLLVLPHFAGAATPYMDSGSRGAVVGLTLATTPQDLYFACLEGVAYEMRLNKDRLAESGVCYNRLVATGGGARSKVWTQIKADVLGVPVVSLETDDAGTVGCAMLAGVAVGVFRDLSEARNTMVREIDSYEPDQKRQSEYDLIFKRYEKLYEAVRPLV